jgi:hypothetical protein
MKSSPLRKSLRRGVTASVPRGRYPAFWQPFCAIIIVLGLAACGQQPAADSSGSEAQVQATALLNTFIQQGSGDWFAVQKFGSQKCLVEMHNPAADYRPKVVTDTDRMNGVTQRGFLTVTCEQFRIWNGHWSDWKASTGRGPGRQFHGGRADGLLGRPAGGAERPMDHHLGQRHDLHR